MAWFTVSSAKQMGHDDSAMEGGRSLAAALAFLAYGAGGSRFALPINPKACLDTAFIFLLNNRLIRT